MTTTNQSARQGSILPFPAAPAARAQIAKAAATWAAWQQRRRLRKDLKRLLRAGPHLIEDVGLTPESAEREIAKPMWRA